MLLVEVVGDGIVFRNQKYIRRIVLGRDEEIDKSLMTLERYGISGKYIYYLEVMGEAWDKMCGMAEL